MTDDSLTHRRNERNVSLNNIVKELVIRKGRELTFISYLLCASHLKYVISLNPYDSSIRFFLFVQMRKLNSATVI